MGSPVKAKSSEYLQVCLSGAGLLPSDVLDRRSTPIHRIGLFRIIEGENGWEGAFFEVLAGQLIILFAAPGVAVSAVQRFTSSLYVYARRMVTPKKKKRDGGEDEEKQERKKMRKDSPAMAAIKELQQKLEKEARIIKEGQTKKDAHQRYPDELEVTEMEGVLDIICEAPEYYRIVRVPTKPADPDR